MIQFLNVSKIYPDGVRALDDVSLHIHKGEFVFLMGPSGAGKTTLLRLLFREELPTRGQVLVAGRNVIRLRRKDIPSLRRNMGLMFQDFRLLDDRPVFDNVALALEVLETGPREIRKKVVQVLEVVGLKGRERAYPRQLSGGEQQRVAIARAIVNSPRILVADEPTGNLDADTAWSIMDLLSSINKRGTTVVVASHARSLAEAMRKRVIRLRAGRLAEDRLKEEA